MTPAAIRELVARELEGGESFENLHGITAANVRSFLVAPAAAMADPDDLETTKREMWLVLSETGDVTAGYVVLYDPLTQRWAVAEHVGEGEFQAVVWGDTFLQAIGAM